MVALTDASRADRLTIFQQRFAAREREVEEIEARTRGYTFRLAPPLAPAAPAAGSYEAGALLAAVKAENDELRRRLDAIEAYRREDALEAQHRARQLAPRASAEAAAAPAAPRVSAEAAAPLPPPPPPPPLAIEPIEVFEAGADRRRARDDEELRRSREQSAPRSPNPPSVRERQPPRHRYGELEKQLRAALARLEMSTHRERQWQRIYISR